MRKLNKRGEVFTTGAILVMSFVAGLIIRAAATGTLHSVPKEDRNNASGWYLSEYLQP